MPCDLPFSGRDFSLHFQCCGQTSSRVSCFRICLSRGLPSPSGPHPRSDHGGFKNQSFSAMGQFLGLWLSGAPVGLAEAFLALYHRLTSHLLHLTFFSSFHRCQSLINILQTELHLSTASGHSNLYIEGQKKSTQRGILINDKHCIANQWRNILFSVQC